MPTMKYIQLRNKYINEKYCNKTFKNNLVLDYHQSIAQTSKGDFNFVEKSILSSKTSSESPADKILKKQPETDREGQGHVGAIDWQRVVHRIQLQPLDPMGQGREVWM